MDLSPNVTRSLRAVDGVLVVVDAVEEIQVQTEIVLKMALKELVKPVLFINKIDRLIKELKLNSKEIQKKLENIIIDFNNLIEIYSKEEYKDAWKINPILGNVGFGCAIYPNWGFTYRILKEKNIKFKKVIEAYEKNDINKLNTLMPLYKSLLTLFIEHLPNPVQAQLYRVKAIGNVKLSSKINDILKRCDKNEHLIMNVFNTIYDNYLNKFAICRVYSGRIHKNSNIFDINLQKEFKVRNLSIFMGAKKFQVEEVPAGNIVAIGGLNEIKIGDTITDLKSKDSFSRLKNIEYFSEPVITVAIEPLHPQQLNQMINFLMILNDNDPNFELNINKDSGEFLISGMGLLHLELISNKLNEKGIEVLVSDPIIVYREVIKNQSPICEAYFEETNRIQIKLDINKRRNNRKFNTIYMDKNNNIVINASSKGLSSKIKNQLLKGFKIALKAGPLCDEPIMNLEIKILDFSFDFKVDNFENKVMLCAKRALFGAFLLSTPTLLQPIYKIEIETSEKDIGTITSLLSKNRAKIDSITSRGFNSKILAYIPVEDSLEFTKELRNLTSGKSIWQMVFSHWDNISKEKKEKIIQKLRLRKGRKLEIPNGLSFVTIIK